MSAPNIRHRARPIPLIRDEGAAIASRLDEAILDPETLLDQAGTPSDLPPEDVGIDEPPPLAPKPSYDVGYGKPPVATRFGGPRGNRSGRKKGSRSHSTIIDEELNAKVLVPGSGKLTKFQVGVRQLVNQAAKGDLKAILPLLKLAQERESAREARHRALQEQSTPPTFDQQDQGVLDLLMEMIGEAAALHPSGDQTNTDKEDM